jgi:hypothetical protein
MNLHTKIQNNNLNISFTVAEINALEGFLRGETTLDELTDDLKEALLKIGLNVPTTNRAGTGKNIKSLLFK